jgi:hypothetical protein
MLIRGSGRLAQALSVTEAHAVFVFPHVSARLRIVAFASFSTSLACRLCCAPQKVRASKPSAFSHISARIAAGRHRSALLQSFKRGVIVLPGRAA